MSDCIEIAHDKHASTITLTNPPFNMLDIETMDALVAAHREADAHPETRIIVTRSGVEGMFSNGLNPMTVIEADTAGRIEIFKGVGRMVKGLYSLRKPHIAVLNGPAMAGGAVFAIQSDFRYMDQQRGAICFAEAKVGVPVPEGLCAIIASVCQPAYLREAVLLGKNFDAQQALHAGLVDGIAPAEELDALVVKQVSRLARLSPQVLSECKASLRAPVFPRIATLLAGDAETSAFARFLGREFLEEGLKAFLEGRPPVFVK